MFTGHSQSGLVSAAIAAFLAPAFIATLSVAPDDSVTILSYISQVLAFATGLTTTRPDTDSEVGPSTASAPGATQILWFCGLAMSLSSALLAILLQSWIRRYMAMTQPRQKPSSRAVIQAYIRLKGSLDFLRLTMDVLHLLLDISIFTFLAGLICLLTLTALNNGVVLAVSYISPILFIIYVTYSLTSFYRHTIYSTPFSRVIFGLVRDPAYSFKLRKLRVNFRERNAFLEFDWLGLDLVDQAADQLIKRYPSLLDGMVASLLRALDDDEDIERFLESIPGVYDSDLVKQPEQLFRPFYEDHVPHLILSFMHHTNSSATLPHDIKQRRISLSLQVMELDPYLLERTFFHTLSLPAKPTTFRCIDFLLVAKRFAGDTKPENANLGPRFLAKSIITTATSHLTSSEYYRLLNPDSESSLSTIAAISIGQFSSEKLDNLVSLIDLSISTDPQYKDKDKILSGTLLAACNFPTENVAAESQRRFCDLWNRLVGDSAATTPASLILPNIRTVYNTLHGGTDDSPINQDLAPTDYPTCIDPTRCHGPDLHSTPGATTTDVVHSSGEAPAVATRQNVNDVATL
jgi:Family of unknown function (DUF6535)